MNKAGKNYAFHTFEGAGHGFMGNRRVPAAAPT